MYQLTYAYHSNIILHIYGQRFRNINYKTSWLKQSLQMTQKIKYKVISYSSQQRQYPVTSLLVPGSDGWQTKRFCNYPQEVTLEFYGVVRIEKIEILADSRKIASTADILYYDPTQSATQSRFIKYGSLQFSKNQSGKIHEQKTVMVDLRCLYLRFLFHRPHKNKQNFFSQVHIHQLTIYGGETNIMLPLDTSIGKKNSIQNSISIDPKSISEQQDQFVYDKLIQIQKRKQQAVMQEDFDEAERMKQIMMNVKKFGYKLKALKDKKNEAAEKEDYQLARSIKEQIDRLKKQVDILVSQTLEGQGYDQEQQQQRLDLEHDVQGNQFVGLEIDKMLDRQSQSRVTNKNNASRIKLNASNLNKKTDRSNYFQNSYDQRVIPALQNKMKTQQSQFGDQNRQPQLGPPEDIDGNHAADASYMMQFFQEGTVKQLFSKNWLHKQKALTDIPVQAAQKPQDAPLIKCLLRVASQTINETNFKLTQLSLSLLREVLKINGKAHKLSKNNVESRDLQKIMQEIIKKMSDNNAKTRNSSQQVFQQMLESSLFGVEYCCANLMKTHPNTKASVKQQAQKLSSLAVMTSKYGLGQNGVPLSVVEYGIEKLANAAAEVRNQAIHLLAVCSSKDNKLVTSQLQGKKSIYLQQIQAKQKQLTNKSGKR